MSSTMAVKISKTDRVLTVPRAFKISSNIIPKENASEEAICLKIILILKVKAKKRGIKKAPSCKILAEGKVLGYSTKKITSTKINQQAKAKEILANFKSISLF
jgi:hypothetical protein